MKAIRISGQTFGEKEIEMIKEVIQTVHPCQRAPIAREVCARLNWYDARGELKAMSCRVALLRLHREKLITLPEPRNTNGNGKPLSKQTIRVETSTAIECAVHELHHLKLIKVETKKESALWNGLIEEHHYLGYQRLPGAQVRYLIHSEEGWLGAVGFGAAAWKVAARDQWIGWSETQREARLNKIINNARFLLLPWVRSKNLASKVLSLCERRVANDFEERYGVRPVLLETFVEQQRFRGTCYKAANWQLLGQTQGRGRRDRYHDIQVPIKDLYVRPLTTHFRAELVA
jgi:hypothetical protein